MNDPILIGDKRPPRPHDPDDGSPTQEPDGPPVEPRRLLYAVRLPVACWPPLTCLACGDELPPGALLCATCRQPSAGV